MFERELMISGLCRQRSILAALIKDLEKRPTLEDQDHFTTLEKTGRIAQNLRKLRKIKDNYVTFQET